MAPEDFIFEDEQDEWERARGIQYVYGQPTPIPPYIPEDAGWDRRVSGVGQYLPIVDQYFTEQHIMSDPALRQAQKEAEIQRSRVAAVAALGLGVGAGYLLRGPLKALGSAGARKILQRMAKEDTAEHMMNWRVNPWSTPNQLTDEMAPYGFRTDPYSQVKLSDQLQGGALGEFFADLPKRLQNKFRKAIQPASEFNPSWSQADIDASIGRFIPSVKGSGQIKKPGKRK